MFIGVTSGKARAAAGHGVPPLPRRRILGRAVLVVALMLACACATPAWAVTGEEDALTMGERDATAKEVPPTLQKEVGQASPDGSIAFGPVADACESDYVTYRLTATLPSNYEEFRSYRYVIEDNADVSLELDAKSVRVRLLREGGGAVDLTKACALTRREHGLTVEFDDLVAGVPQAHSGDRVVVEYRSRLVAGRATRGFEAGNVNRATLRYTRTPGGDELGSTVPAEATVYTWALRVVKRDARTDKGLAGASFSLGRADGFAGNLASGQTDDGGIVDMGGLGSGSYVLRESVAPRGYDRLVKDVGVTLRADLASGRLDVSSDSASARIESVDSKTGLVTLVVHDEPLGGTSSLPRTGDARPPVLVAAVGAALVVVSAVVRKRGRRGD